MCVESEEEHFVDSLRLDAIIQKSKMLQLAEANQHLQISVFCLLAICAILIVAIIVLRYKYISDAKNKIEILES